MGGDRRQIDQFAARQLGTFNTRQLRKAGFDKSAVARHCAAGAWIRLCPNVFALASAPPSWERGVAASVLSRPQAIVGGSTAAYLHGLDGVRRGTPVIVVPVSANARSSIARVVRHHRFDEIETVRVRGFQASSVPETLVLLARQLAKPRLVSTFDDALINGQLKLSALDRVLMRDYQSSARGMSAMRELADTRAPAAPQIDGSHLERLTESLLRRGGFTGWVREFPLTIRGARSRVDFYFDSGALVVEADGRTWHLRAEGFDDDRRRDNQLAALGIQVLRFTYRMLTQEPDQCLATITQVLGQRRALRSDMESRLHIAG